LVIVRVIGAEIEPGLAPQSSNTANPFPEVNEVFEGRVFTNAFEREVFFLKRIREDYATHWPALLSANITINDYVVAPGKLLRFIEALGTAIAGTDDLVAATNLAVITADPSFYANSDAYRPEILRAAALVLIQIGPKGRRALADSFNENHYRMDPGSLEVLAEAISKSPVADSRLNAALAGAAFTFTTTNGGSFPKCTREATRSLLAMPDGPLAVAAHLNIKEVFADPGRYQAVIDGVRPADRVALRTNLVELEKAAVTKLGILTNSPGPYREELSGLHARLRQTNE
jgi:hypothetical protein